MHVLQGIRGIQTPSKESLTAQECRRNFSLGKKLFTAFLVSESLSAVQINDFHIFLTLIVSLEKSIRARFIFTQDLKSLTLMSLTKVEVMLEDFESPVAELFKDDLLNLKYTLENSLIE